MTRRNAALTVREACRPKVQAGFRETAWRNVGIASAKTAPRPADRLAFARAPVLSGTPVHHNMAFAVCRPGARRAKMPAEIPWQMFCIGIRVALGLFRFVGDIHFDAVMTSRQRSVRGRCLAFVPVLAWLFLQFSFAGAFVAGAAASQAIASPFPGEAIIICTPTGLKKIGADGEETELALRCPSCISHGKLALVLPEVALGRVGRPVIRVRLTLAAEWTPQSLSHRFFQSRAPPPGSFIT